MSQKKPLKPSHIVLGLLLGMFIGLAFLPQKETGSPMQEALPELKLRTLDGQVFDAADARGKVLLVHFWASWCAPCVREFPDLLETVAAHPDDVVLLTISADLKEEDATAFIAAIDTEADASNMHHVWDNDLTISQNIFQVMTFPETIIADGEGIMVHKVVGAAPDWSRTLRPHLAAQR